MLCLLGLLACVCCVLILLSCTSSYGLLFWSTCSFWWLKVKALAGTNQWLELDRFSKSKKSPIGYEVRTVPRPYLFASVAGGECCLAKLLALCISDGGYPPISVALPQDTVFT